MLNLNELWTILDRGEIMDDKVFFDENDAIEEATELNNKWRSSLREDIFKEQNKFVPMILKLAIDYEIERCEDTARERAYDSGYSDGYDSGRDEEK